MRAQLPRPCRTPSDTTLPFSPHPEYGRHRHGWAVTRGWEQAGEARPHSRKALGTPQKVMDPSNHRLHQVFPQRLVKPPTEEIPTRSRSSCNTSFTHTPHHHPPQPTCPGACRPRACPCTERQALAASG